MKTFKSVTKLAIALCLMISMLTGCYYENIGATLQPDGSGEVIWFLGGTDEILDVLGLEVGEDLYWSYDIDGVSYWGDWFGDTFDNVDEFNSLMENVIQEEYINMTYFNCKHDKDKKTFEVIMNFEEFSEKHIDAYKEYLIDFVEANELDANINNLDNIEDYIKLDLELGMYYDIEMITEANDAIQVNGDNMVIDLKSIGDTEVRFIVYIDDIQDDSAINAFSDIKESDWYYDALDYAYYAGIINGMGDGTFNPNGTLTYGQFCQILAKWCLVDVGEEDGHWAGKACHYCIDMGYVDAGFDYDAPITREVAVAAMVRVDYTGGVWRGPDIISSLVPLDLDRVEDRYKSDIETAYKTGVVSGVDSIGTFNPKGNLTRAEICQLFYNRYMRGIGWDI